MDWQKVFEELDLEKWSTSEICTLLCECMTSDVEGIEEGFLPLQWVLSKEHVTPENVLCVLNWSYFINITEQERLERFRSNLEKSSDKKMKALHKLAKSRRLDYHHTGQDFLVNLLGETVKKGVPLVVCPEEPQLILVGRLGGAGLKRCYELFGDDFLSRLCINDSASARPVFDLFKATIESSPKKLWYYADMLLPKGSRYLLAAAADYFVSPECTQCYADLFIRYPSYLRLLMYMQQEDVAKQSLEKVSPRVFQAYFKAMSPSKAAVEESCDLYIKVKKYLSTASDSDKLMCEGIVSLLFSYCRDTQGDILDEHLIGKLKSCALLPYIEKQMALWVSGLEAAVSDGIESAMDLWSGHERERTIIKAIYPELRFGTYPYDIHECLAFYLEKCCIPKGELPERVWEDKLVGHLKERFGDEVLAEYKRKILAQAFVMTGDSEFREQLVPLLQSEERNKVPWWRSGLFWPRMTSGAIDALVRRENEDGLVALSKVLSSSIETLEESCDFYLRLKQSLSTVSDEAMCEGIVSLLFSYRRDTHGDILDECLIKKLKSCALLPYIEKQMLLWGPNLETAVSAGIGCTIDLWSKHKHEQTVIKAIYPELMFEGCPRDIYECLAFYFERCCIQEGKSPERVWEDKLIGYLKERFGDEALAGYKRKVLAQAFVMTGDSEFGEQLVPLLQSEEINKEPWWRSRHFWPRMTFGVIEALMYRKNEEGLVALSKVLSSSIETLEESCDSYLRLKESLSTVSDEAMCEGIVSLLFSYRRDTHGDILDECLIKKLKSCALLPYIEKQMLLWGPNLETVVSAGIGCTIDLWSKHKHEQTVIKAIYPELMFEGYPRDIYECLAFYFERCCIQEGKSPERVWEDKLIGYLKERFGDEALAGYKRKVLAQAFVMTGDSEFGEQLVPLLQSEEIDKEPWWRSRHFWPRMTFGVIEALMYRKNEAGLLVLEEQVEGGITEIIAEVNCSALLTLAARLDNFKIVRILIRYQGENKPDSDAVGRALGAAARAGQWKIVWYVLRMSGENKPGSEAVGRVLDTAACAGQWVIVWYVLRMSGENKPGSEAVGRVLDTTACAGQWLIVWFVLKMLGENKPGSGAVCKVLKKVVDEGRWEIVRLILKMLGENKPGSGAVCNVLKKVVDEGRWEIVRLILKMTGENKLGSRAVGYALTAAAHAGQWEIVWFVLKMSGENKPDEFGVGGALIAAAGAGQWEIVWFILKVSGENKPGSYEVGRALFAAAGAGRWEIVQFILEMSGENKPGSGAVCKVLKKAVDGWRWEAARARQWEIVRFILKMSGENKPGRDAVGRMLAYVAHVRQWKIVRLILKMSGENKPATFGVVSALADAVCARQWGIVRFILEMSGENKPHQYAVGWCTLLDAVRARQWGIVKFILEMSGENKPNEYAVGRALADVIRARQWGIVQFKLEMSGENKPHQYVVGCALVAAAHAGKWGIAQFILEMSGENKPASYEVGRALAAAAQAGQWRMVQFILEMSGGNKPDKEAVKDALFAAARAGQWVNVWLVLRMSGENKPTGKTVQYALVEGPGVTRKILNMAAGEGQWELIRLVLSLWGRNKPSSRLVSWVLDVAASEGQWEVVQSVLEMDGDNKPNSDAVGRALKVAACAGQCGIVQFILKMIGENRPNSKAVGKALKHVAGTGQKEVVQLILSLSEKNKPCRSTLKMSLQQALDYGQDDIAALIQEKIDSGSKSSKGCLVSLFRCHKTAEGAPQEKGKTKKMHCGMV